MAEVRDEMRNIQQNCLDQIEAVQAEKQAEIERFEKEKQKMEA